MDRIDRRLLFQRIEAHGLDEPNAADPFSARLARDNGWSPAYTRRAIGPEPWARTIRLQLDDDPMSPY